MSTKNIFLPTTTSKKKIVLIIFFIFLIYTIDYKSISNSIINSSIFNYVIRPSLWFGLFLFVYLQSTIRPKSLLRHRSFLNLWSFNFAIIYIIISVLAGIVDSLGKSPYSHTPTGILLNMLFIVPLILGREYARSYLVSSLVNKKEKYSIFVLVALLMTFSKISLNKVLMLNSYIDILEYIAKYFAPEFCQSLLATFLVFLGGPMTSIIYYCTLEGFHWLSPILPDLKWIVNALVGILVPIFCFIGIQHSYQIISKQLKVHRYSKENPISWMITSLISIVIIWFAVGVFPIYPAVIATGSMEPMIKPGDVILVKKIYKVEEVNTGDVILFQEGNIRIAHRVIEIIEDKKEGTGFKTKGDNNSVADSSLVKPQQLKGIVVKVVPKIGWPTLLIKSSKNDVQIDQVEF